MPAACGTLSKRYAPPTRPFLSRMPLIIQPARRHQLPPGHQAGHHTALTASTLNTRTGRMP